MEVYMGVAEPRETHRKKKKKRRQYTIKILKITKENKHGGVRK